MERRLRGAAVSLAIAIGMIGLCAIVLLGLYIASCINEQYGREVAIASAAIGIMLLCSIIGFIYPGDD